MRIWFFAAPKPRERILAEAWKDGCERHGDECKIVITNDGIHDVVADMAKDLDNFPFDVAVMYGVKSRKLWNAMPYGVAKVMLDKGLLRTSSNSLRQQPDYTRVAVNAHHPTAYLMSIDKPSDRFKAWGLGLSHIKEHKGHIILVGSSEKYHEFYGLPHPNEYYSKIIKRLNKLTDRDIIYRPKPSWRDATPIDGSRFSFGQGETMRDLLVGASLVVTHGSNASLDAALAGIPSIVLGDAVGKCISSTRLEDVNSPRLADIKDIRKWVHNLAYCQWTTAEFASGLAWEHIKPLTYL